MEIYGTLLLNYTVKRLFNHFLLSEKDELPSLDGTS